MTRASQQVTIAPDAAGIDRAADILRSGGLVAVPTETVYGLAARADRAEAVAAIYRAKGRPGFNPLIVHVADVAAARRLARFDARAEKLAEQFWPGALTLVLPLRDDSGLAPAVTAGLPTLALRCPAHPVMRALLSQSGLALAAPSANRSGGVSPTTAEHVRDSLGDSVQAILDGGPCALGLESTIVVLRESGGWQVLRPGPIGEDAIAAAIGASGAADPHPDTVEAPGQLISHYSPGKPVRLDAISAQRHEFHIGFGAVTGDANLSAEGDLAQAAARLYEVLHRASAAPQRAIAVAPIPLGGLGTAIRDRLQRAAADQS